ncbi:MAG: CobW family GTP-binding protein [Burkholderiaceae bacterium]
MSVHTEGLGVLVVGGYLGAGKTTLVNHLLRHANGRRIAVMVNDFGEIGIDADLILGQDGEILQLAGGCICCSVGSDLVESLMSLAGRTPRPDLVLIETSGVALPGQVARGAALAPGIIIDGVVVLVDTPQVRQQTQDRHIGDTVAEQLRQADLLVLNKAEALDESRLGTLQDWIAGQAPRARQLVCTEAAVPAEVVLGLGQVASHEERDTTIGRSASAAERLPLGRRAALARASRGLRPAASIFESASLPLQGAFDLEGLAQALAEPSLGLVRVKGLVQDGSRQMQVLQMTGSRWRITAAPQTDRAQGQQTFTTETPSTDGGRLLMIGLKGQLDHRIVGTIVERFNVGK